MAISRASSEINERSRRAPKPPGGQANILETDIKSWVVSFALEPVASLLDPLALIAAPSLLILRRTKSLKRLEDLVVVVVGNEVHTKVEPGGTQPSHQGGKRRLSPAGLVGGHRWLGDANAIRKFSLR